MIRLEMKTYNRILTEKQQKNQYHNQVKLMNMNILHMEKNYFPVKVKLNKKTNFGYSGKSLEKQTKAVEDAAKREAKTIENRVENQIINTHQFIIDI